MKIYRIANRNPLDILSQKVCTKILEYFKNTILSKLSDINGEQYNDIFVDNIKYKREPL